MVSSLTDSGIWNLVKIIDIFKNKWTTFYETNKAYISPTLTKKKKRKKKCSSSAPFLFEIFLWSLILAEKWNSYEQSWQIFYNM